MQPLQFSSVTWPYPTLRPHGLQHARLPCPSPTPKSCSKSCPSSRWYHPTISFSAQCTISLISHASKVMQSLKNRENKTKPEKTEVDPEAVEHGSKQWIISLHSFRYCLTWPVLGNSLLWLFKNQWKLKKNKKKNVVSHLPSFGNVGRVLLIRFAIPKLGGAESHLHSCFAFLGILSPHWVFWSLRVGHLHAAYLFHSQRG